MCVRHVCACVHKLRNTDIQGVENVSQLPKVDGHNVNASIIRWESVKPYFHPFNLGKSFHKRFWGLDEIGKTFPMGKAEKADMIQMALRR